jgi:hypothetical protein
MKPPAALQLKPGDKLGPYEIIFAIGVGGMGEVWKRHPVSRFGCSIANGSAAKHYQPPKAPAEASPPIHSVEK